MAKKKKDQAFGADQFKQAKEQIQNLQGVPDDVKEKMIADMQSQVGDAARQQMVESLTKVMQHDNLSEARNIFGGQRLSVSFTFTEDGDIERITDRISTPRSRSSSSRSGKQYEVNGETYNTAADAARANDIDFKGDSAVRALERALSAGQIESFNVVESEEDEDEGEGEDES